MTRFSRRTFLKNSIAGSVGVAAAGDLLSNALSKREFEVKVLNPLNRVPVSFIIDDSTALVNMAYFGIPQFKEVFPDQYRQDWKKLPREIPDSFVEEFAGWCRDHGVKGKYSMVPYPACTGWLHRFIPGWSNNDLDNSIKLVRDHMTEDWDIHPEMISHTRVINIKTGLPYPHATPEYMENWEWSQDKSADELGAYIVYALNVLKEAGFVCEGMTTPGGFGSRNMDNLALGTLEAVRDVYGPGVPHFFRNIRTDPNESVEPELFHVSGLGSNDPRCSVHIIGCTGDWFGGWDGLTPGDADRFINGTLDEGRLVEVIDSGQPAIMVCHWPGIYYNGTKLGFNIFKTVVERIHQKYDNLLWMKLSEIARYWAAKKLAKLHGDGNHISINAPFGTQDFTLKAGKQAKQITVSNRNQSVQLNRIDDPGKLSAGTFYSSGNESIICFELLPGISNVSLS